jgi:hypothetical protein
LWGCGFILFALRNGETRCTQPAAFSSTAGNGAAAEPLRFNYFPREMIMADHRRPFPAANRRLVMFGAAAAAILLIVVAVWPLMTSSPLGTPPGGVNPSSDSDTTISRGAPAQRAAESTVGKTDPAGLEDSSGGRARAIKESSQPLQLNVQQLQRLREIVSQQPVPRLPRAPFEMMIGAAVPQQVELTDVPLEITQVMNGYWGAQYVLVEDKLVIVDRHSKRVVAIVPSVG